MAKKQSQEERDPVSIRLDAIIRLLIESNKDKEDFSIGETIRTLNSVGLTPTEIARIFGKKSYTDIAPHLYSKKKAK